MKTLENYRDKLTGKRWQVTTAYQPPKNRQCFFLHKELFEALTEEVVVQTVMDLKELNLYNLPYNTVDIKFIADELLRWRDPTGSVALGLLGPDSHVILANIDNAECDNVKLIINDRGRTYVDVSEYILTKEGKQSDNVTFYRDALIVLLATKNVQKTTTINQLAKLGIGKGEHVYTTTLRLPKDYQDLDNKATTDGRPVRPHLRRGHIRRQHFGPKNSAIKKIWIEPCFVNADEEFVSKREAYNVS